MACTLAKPIVDGIEREFEGRLQVLRVNIQNREGQELASQYHSLATPTFILFDAEGQEIYRSVGQVDPQALQDILAENE